MSAVIDWEQLDMIGDGFTEDFVEIYREFVAEVPGLLARLRESIAAADTSQAARLAHQLKGSAANFGFVGVSTPMAALEADAQNKTLDRATEYAATAEAGFEAALAEVRARHGV
jgi:HPt (histidine-containing phosphotransfer) domain-containing protein